MDHLCYLCLAFVMLLRLFMAALWLSFVVFNCVFVTLPCGILGQAWYLIVSIPDLCRLSDIVIASVRPLCYLLLNHWTKYNQIWCVSYSHECGVQLYLHSVQIIIPIDLICRRPQVQTLGHDLGVRTKSRSICFISFICVRKFVLSIL